MDLTQGSAARRLVRFTLPIIVMNIFGQLYSLVDSVIVAQFAGGRSLSVLAAVNGCMAIGYCLVQGAAGACHIVLANHYGARRFDEFRDAAHTMRLVMAIFSSLVADVLTSLYLPDRSGAAFALARSYLLLLIPNYFLQFGKSSLEAVFKAHLKISLVTVSAMLSLAVRVALGYALAPSYGITALAWATNAGSAAALALCFVFYRTRFHGMPA